MTEVAPLVPGRSCEGCTLCCKLLRVPALDKPRGQWCVHCKIGVGCNIYDDRPQECGIFYCAYRLTTELDEWWKPSDAHMMVRYDERRISVFVEASRASDWRKPPYYQQIKNWARLALPQRGQVIVWEGLDAVAVFPDREKPLGRVGPNQVLANAYTPGPLGERVDVVVMEADDPRLGQGAGWPRD